MNTYTLPWLNLRKSLAHVDHPDQPSVYAGFIGLSSFENARVLGPPRTKCAP